MSSPPLTFDALLREHGMRGLSACRCGAWWTAMDEYGAVDQFRKHLAAVLLAHVREAHEGLAAEWDRQGSLAHVGGYGFHLAASDLRALTEETR